MATFKYIATNKDRKPVQGTITAEDRGAALASLKKQDLQPVSLKEIAQKSNPINLKAFDLFGKKGVKSDALVIFTRQLSTMIGAGVPLLRSLSSLRSHMESKALASVLDTVIVDVEAGSPFCDALAKHPAVFSDVYVNMVRSAEAAGILDDVLNRLAAQQEKNATIRKKIKSAMSYPTVLAVIMTIAFFGLMLFVVPQIGKIVTDLGGPEAQLPVITQIMLGLSSFLINFWWFWVPVLVGAIYGIVRYLRTPAGRNYFQRLLLRVPAVKTIVIKISVARFARTFSALMGAGVAVLEALHVTSRAVGNVVYEEALLDAAEKVKEGKQLSEVLATYDELFPAIVAQMLAVGEETGQTDTVLVKVADFYEEEVDVAIDGLGSIIEPVMIVLMGSMVGLIAASVMSPIASLSQNIK